MTEVVIEQAVFSRGQGRTLTLARSAGFLDEWVPVAEALCVGFGERQAGVRCPACVFAKPFGDRHVAAVQAADDAGRPGVIGFRFLVVARDAYGNWIGDPFLLSDRFPPDWQARGELPTLSWAAAPPAPRT